MSLSFLHQLYTPYPADAGLLCEVRCLPPNRAEDVLPTARFFGLSKLNRAADFAHMMAQTHDVYMGVLPRSCVAPAGQAGRDVDVSMAAWLWCDIDRGEATDAEMVSFLEHIKSRLPMPQFVVFSGSGGVHLYWGLYDVARLETSEQCEEFSSILRRVVAAVGHGPGNAHADKSCCNVSRILRCPQTYNHKHDPPRQVQAAVCRGDTLTLAQWDERLPMEPLPPRALKPKFTAQGRTWSGNTAPPGLVAWAERGYPEGARHQDLVGAAAFLRRDTDLPESVAHSLFLVKATNSLGRRSLTEDELDNIWNWAA